MIHEPDRPGQYDWWTNKDDYYGPVIELLEELKKDGVIGYIGLGGTTAYMTVIQNKLRRSGMCLSR